MTEQQVSAGEAWFVDLRRRAEAAGRRNNADGTPAAAAAFIALLVEMRECARGRPLMAADIQTVITSFMEATKMEEITDGMGTLYYGARS